MMSRATITTPIGRKRFMKGDLTWALIKMTGKRAPALHRDLLHHASQLAHPRDEFQSELPPLDAGGGALVRRPDRFFLNHLRQCRSHWGLDKMGSRFAHRHPPNDLATLPGVLFYQRRRRSGIGAHRKARLAPR